MNRFVRLSLLGALCLGSAVLSVEVLAQQRPVAAGAASGEITGKVMVVNAEKRMLTIRAPDGEFHVIHVPREVKRLDEIKINDKLTISYLEAVAVDLAPKVRESSAERQLEQCQRGREVATVYSGPLGALAKTLASARSADAFLVT